MCQVHSCGNGASHRLPTVAAIFLSKLQLISLSLSLSRINCLIVLRNYYLTQRTIQMKENTFNNKNKHSQHSHVVAPTLLCLCLLWTKIPRRFPLGKKDSAFVSGTQPQTHDSSPVMTFSKNLGHCVHFEQALSPLQLQHKIPCDLVTGAIE